MDLNTTQVSAWIQDNYIGDYASIIGLVITLIGFGITIYNLRKTRTASEVATSAVNNIRKDLKKVDTVSNLASVLTEMEEIKQLHRAKSHSKLPEKYSKLRASLIYIKKNNNILEEGEHRILQSAIVQLRSFEKTIDKAMETDINSTINQINISKSNDLVSSHIDKLQEVLIRVKSTIGE